MAECISAHLSDFISRYKCILSDFKALIDSYGEDVVIGRLTNYMYTANEINAVDDNSVFYWRLHNAIHSLNTILLNSVYDKKEILDKIQDVNDLLN